MYDYETGAYIFRKDTWPNESIYKKETTYYIKYNSKKALYALSKLFGPFKGCLEERCFYYHVYLDILFEAVGQITNRTKEPTKKDKNNYTNMEKQAEVSRKEYGFDKEEYKVLQNNKIRNFIQHINEKDEVLINDNLYHGTFNLIYQHMSKKTKRELLNTEKPQNNLLNLCDKTYTIYYVDNKTGKKEMIIVDLKELYKDIESINIISNKIWNYITEPFWE